MLCATNVAFGWLLGYRDPEAYAACWAMAALLAGTAWLVASRAFGPAPRTTALIRATVLALATIVFIAGLLGAVGQLTGVNVLGAEALAFAGATLLPRRPDATWRWSPPPLPAAAVAVI